MKFNYLTLFILTTLSFQLTIHTWPTKHGLKMLRNTRGAMRYKEMVIKYPSLKDDDRLLALCLPLSNESSQEKYSRLNNGISEIENFVDRAKKVVVWHPEETDEILHRRKDIGITLPKYKDICEIVLFQSSTISHSTNERSCPNKKFIPLSDKVSMLFKQIHVIENILKK